MLLANTWDNCNADVSHPDSMKMLSHYDWIKAWAHVSKVAILKIASGIFFFLHPYIIKHFLLGN